MENGAVHDKHNNNNKIICIHLFGKDFTVYEWDDILKCWFLPFYVSDLLTIDPHTPTPEPASHEKTDGQWYSHDGVDVKDTQQRKGMLDPEIM